MFKMYFKNLDILSIFILPILTLAFFFSGCAAFTEYGKLGASAKKNYALGDYDSAVSDAVKSLKLKPDYEASLDILPNAFKATIDQHESKIAQLKSSSTQFKGDNTVEERNQIVREYEAMINRISEVKSLPPNLVHPKTKQVLTFEFKDYAAVLSEAKEKVAEAKEKAAEVHYQKGLRLIKDEKIDIQKQAAKEFKTALSYISGYKDAESLYEKARRAGIKRIAIIPFEDKSGKKDQYGAVAETVLDKIVSNIMNDGSAMEFLEIISRDQLEQVMREQQLGMTGIIDEKTAMQVGKILGVNEIVTGKITQIAVTPERKISRMEERSNTVRRLVGDKWIDRNIYANVTIYEKASNSSISGSYQIIDVKTAVVKKQGAFNGKYDFESKWATYTGDAEALNSQDRSYGSEQFAPSPEEMVSKAANNLAITLSSEMKSYAK
jgi:hypothetical protein